MAISEPKNGHIPNAEERVRQAYERLSRIGRGQQTDPLPMPEPLTAEEEAEQVERHPEDPLGAFEDSAAEVCDPEQIRVKAVRTSKGSQAIRPEVFEPLYHQMLEGIADTRVGAIVAPAQVDAGEELQTSLMTDKDVERIVRDCVADGMKADLLEQTELPQSLQEVEKRQADVRDAESGVRAADERVDELRPSGIAEDKRPGGLVAWVRFAPAAAITLGLVAMVINAVVLQPAISNLVNTSELGTYLLALGLSATFELSSFAAGFALASIRLPGKAVGVFFVALFALIMLKLIIGLDALREGLPSGVITLTAGTLASCYVAGLAGYAEASWRDFATRRELVLKAGTALADVLDARTEARALLADVRDRLAQAEAAVVQLREEVVRLRDSAARADSSALVREAEGIRAEVRQATIESNAATHSNQERAAVRWAFAVGRLMHLKTRAEKLTHREPDSSNRPTDRHVSPALNWLQKAAIAALGAGALAELLIGPVSLAIGAGLAAILLLLSSQHRLTWRRSQVVGDGPVNSAINPVGATADQDHPLYRRQPTHMVPKYSEGAPTSGERQ